LQSTRATATRAQFRVHSSSSGHHDDNGDHDAKVAAGVLIGAAILGAIAANRKNDHKYDDANYQGRRHTSYVPGWMVGTFEGYNPIYNADVTLTIDASGRATARSERGNAVSGWINDGRLNVGNHVFDIDQSRDGFVTSEVGDRHNEVRYRRMR
jgi:hypothetical protein